ncbi:MAG TPA: phosphopyruvate hydratase [Actinomycetota bacterium]|nr:phosphopyruvate hydratase [Actinomycetota bacterium]
MGTTGLIERVFAWEALDSRGTPTVACEVSLSSGATGTVIVPSGASTGRHEAHELRDGGQRYGGRGVQQAVRNVNDVLGPAVKGHDAGDQRGLDGLLREADGTANLSALGANAVLAVSLAALIARAHHESTDVWRLLLDGRDPLMPLPMVNIVSGGAHAGGAVDIQDVLVVPVGASSFAEAIEWSWRVRLATAQACEARRLPATLAADEGGLGPRLDSNRQALELVAEGLERSGLQPGSDVAIAVDVAATQLWRDGSYRLEAEGRTVDASGLLAEIESWCDTWPVVSVEDPVADDDWDGWSEASRRLGPRVQLLGDDLFATNAGRLSRGAADGIANAVLIKPNQNGTVTGTSDVLEQARTAGYATVVSARSGETEDSWLSDLAVGWRAGQIKVGSTTRSERTAKWNRLLRIEAEPGGVAFAGRQALGGSHVDV